eukprot:TRINITY_DN73257_c0_g1_i1.p2 TRINITY_DN73257_c0_g1~~TRINITY_DN73257_c0_g1_i1.p2  ORF type:complete len:161 (+),score=23.24 TRINITY_DN73257_c0_g1_i1:59-541(+)
MGGCAARIRWWAASERPRDVTCPRAARDVPVLASPLAEEPKSPEEVPPTYPAVVKVYLDSDDLGVPSFDLPPEPLKRTGPGVPYAKGGDQLVPEALPVVPEVRSRRSPGDMLTVGWEEADEEHEDGSLSPNRSVHESLSPIMLSPKHLSLRGGSQGPLSG